MAKDVKALSSWVRQLRHRAKKHNLFNDLSINEIQEVIEQYNGLCCLCSNRYDLLDTAFPLRDGAPNVQANVLPLCNDCKEIKKNDDILCMVSNNLISSDKFTLLLKRCFNNNHGDRLASYVKVLSGNVDA